MKRRILSLFAAVILILTALGSGAPQAAAAPQPFKIAALGDSFSAGTWTGTSLILPGKKSTWCYRTSAAYPVLLAGDRAKVPTLQFVACSGAGTSDIVREQVTSYGEVPPQIAALSSTTNEVTLTIGGNDAGFGTVLECLQTPGASGCDPATINARVAAGLTALSSPRPSTIKISGHSVRITGLPTTLAAIHDRAPHAKIFVAGYPLLLASCGGSSAQQVNALNVALNGTIQAVVNKAARSGMRVKYVDATAAFAGHDRCTADPWIGPELHPTVRGQAAYAAAFRAAGFVS